MHISLLLVVVAQLLNAIVSLVDKYIVTSPRALPHPFTYAFYVSVLSAGSIFVFTFFLGDHTDKRPCYTVLRKRRDARALRNRAFHSGRVHFFQALISLFTALRESHPADVVPVVGAVSAAATFVLSWLFFGGLVHKQTITGFLLLVLGTLLVSHYRFNLRTTLLVAHAGVLYALHYVVMKSLFNVTSFDNAFFWSRLAIAGVALMTLMVPLYYDKVMHGTKAAHRRGGVLLMGNKVIAGLASILVLKAIEYGDVALVQALGGLQYVFLLVLGLVFGNVFLHSRSHPLPPADRTQQAISVAVIVLGFFMLFV